MESASRGYEFIVIEDKVETIPLPNTLKTKIKAFLRLPQIEQTYKTTILAKWYTTDLKYISSVGQVRTPSGKVYNTRCAIFSTPENSWMIVKGRFSEITKLLDSRFDHKNIVEGYGRKISQR